MKLITLTGRILFSLIFFFAGLPLFGPATAAYASSQGVPLANVLVPIAGVLSVLGSISLFLGYKTRIGAAMKKYIDPWRCVDPAGPGSRSL